MLDLVQRALDFGFSQAALLDISTLILRDEVRDMCAADKCQKYGRSWNCPPACGSLEENARKIERCASGLLVQTTGVMSDDFDYEAMEKTGEEQQQRFSRFYILLKEAHPAVLGLGSGGCTLCQPCAYPDSPCRRPNEATTSMEAYGLWVSDVCARNQLPYNYGPRTITYTGCYLFPK